MTRSHTQKWRLIRYFLVEVSAVVRSISDFRPPQSWQLLVKEHWFYLKMRIRFIITRADVARSMPQRALAPKGSQAFAKEGKTAEEIADRLGQLFQVLLDWRNEVPGVPSSLSPWQWSRKDLNAFIERRTKEWRCVTNAPIITLYLYS